MKKILAIGGSVIETAREELIDVIRSGQVEMLIHNGGSLFHDFQLATEDLNGRTSYTLDNLIEDYSPNGKASHLVWEWLAGRQAPVNSATLECEMLKIPVLMFTGLGCDYWQLFNDSWEYFAKRCVQDFSTLCTRFTKEFHYVCMGSSVIHPEVFIKAVSVAKNKSFRADVVDVNDVYRPRTRVAKFGTYFQITHKEYLKGLV